MISTLPLFFSPCFSNPIKTVIFNNKAQIFDIPMAQIKTIGSNGQISLGKEFAGQNVLIDNSEYGVWTIKIGKFIPHNEQWLLEKDNVTKLDEALDWASNNQPTHTDLTDLENTLSSKFNPNNDNA